MSSRRVQRVARMVSREVSNIILFELKDPRIKSVTVTKTEVSADLRHAKVFVSVMAVEKEAKLVFHGLNHARGHIQKAVGERLKMKFSPSIQFVEDDSVKKGLRISQLIKKALER